MPRCLRTRHHPVRAAAGETAVELGVLAEPPGHAHRQAPPGPVAAVRELPVPLPVSAHRAPHGHSVPGPARVALAAVAAVVAAVVVGGCAVVGTGAAGEPGSARVVRVVDGDTLVLRLGRVEEPVRLIGIDTPETKDPRSPVECFGEEASRHLAALVPPGTVLRVERDVEARDRYGRLLAYVYRADDGLFVNLAMARDGMAAASTYPPNVAHTDALVAAASEARSAGRGLWGACAGPHDPAR